MYHKFPTFGTIAFLLLYTSETRFPAVLGLERVQGMEGWLSIRMRPGVRIELEAGGIGGPFA
jgi:hypothetical protein